MFDTILVVVPDTWPHPEARRLRGSPDGFLRSEPPAGYLTTHERPIESALVYGPAFADLRQG